MPQGDKPSGVKPGKSSSHKEEFDSFGIVYVNETARHPLFDEKKPQYPIGSVIVREKLKQENAAPELLAVMVKREKGFNPKANDWEFLLLDGDAGRIRERQKTGSCRDCHTHEKKIDYVFRTYLPRDIRLKQK